tara:strand:+ start:9662 stop:12604 length:2943 start_codon:yes stop_codon:yes gene_type:complete
MNINIKSIDPFRDLSQESIQAIEENSQIINFPIGFPILNKDIIPNEVLIILSGEARLLINNPGNTSSITLLGKNTFIGLPSILRAEGCENISASTDLMALSIPEKLILSIYQQDVSFKNWCDSKIQIPEAYEIAEKLQNKSTRSIEDLKYLLNLLINNISLKVYNNGEKYQSLEDEIGIIGSANINNNFIGDILENSKEIDLRGPLPGRIFLIKKSIYSQLVDRKPLNQTTNENFSDQNNSKINETEEPRKLINTSEEIGQYNNDKEFKLIKGNGDIRETLACLQMLSLQLDLPYKNDTIEKILRDSIREGKKPSIQLVGGITSMMGLYSTIAKVEPKAASRLPYPSLITWQNSFAVVKLSNSNLLEIASPSQGLITLKPEDFEESFGGNSFEILLVEKNEQTPESKFGINWLLPSINRYRSVLLQVFFASFIVQLLTLANPLMIQVIIDKVISQRSLDTLQILGFALVFVTIIGGVISSLRTFLFTETTNRIDTRLGAEVIDHLLRLPLKYFDKRPVGELGSRIGELEKIRNFLTGQALTTLLDAAFSLIYIVVMVFYSWLLTFIALAVVPIQIFITLIGTPLIRRQIREIAQQNAITQSHLVEVLTGVQTVKAQNVERVSRWKWQELYGKYISKTFEKTITGTTLNETSKVLNQISQLVILWVGATLVLKGQLTLGQLIAFRIISGYVTQPILRLSTIWQSIQELRVSFERLADIIDTPEEASEADKGMIPLPSIKGKVDFENVSFSFERGQINILNNISLTIKAGQFVGIVGQSGSGKSTLMKLLPRLYKPNKGRILIDGYDVSKVELYSLRRQIGIVPQEPLLFAGTINENISLTDPDATSDEILRASKISESHDFIMRLKDGYSTKIGERGAGLSGGQKQRIAIARTLLSNPKLLIMDEATSALDYDTERKVCEGLKNSCIDSTVFFITHRLSTVKNSDTIIMLHEGSIAEVGTHKELMEKKGRYFALYRQQESS